MAAGDGLISMTPTSIAHAGTSASINADGGVDFTAVTSLSLNGVFTGDYDNYLMVIYYDAVVDNTDFRFRLRASGSDNSTASSYVSQSLNAVASAASANRLTQNSGRLHVHGNPQRNAFSAHFYGPYLAQPTAIRSVTMSDIDNATITDHAITHNQSTAYDGLTLLAPGSGDSVTGTVHVFGYEE